MCDGKIPERASVELVVLEVPYEDAASSVVILIVSVLFVIV